LKLFRVKIDAPERGDIRPKHIEPVLRQHMDIIDTFSWVTQDFHNLQDLQNYDLRTRDLSRTGEQIVRLYGVTPRLFESAHNKVIAID